VDHLALGGLYVFSVVVSVIAVIPVCRCVQDLTAVGRLVAIRIVFLAKGTIVSEPEKFVGSVEKEAGVTHCTPCTMLLHLALLLLLL